MAGRLEVVRAAAKRAGDAVAKLATAASPTHGFDCVVHAELGRRLLQELGLEAQLMVGNAAWRVGPTPDDTVGHMYQVKGHVPPGSGPAFPFHAWLRVGDILVDFTTYQLRTKAASLDALDGGKTVVDWCPEMLVVPLSEVATFEQALKSPAGAFHYEHIPQMQTVITRGMQLDEEDVQMALLILRNPQAQVLGPNHLTSK